MSQTITDGSDYCYHLWDEPNKFSNQIHTISEYLHLIFEECYLGFLWGNIIFVRLIQMNLMFLYLANRCSPFQNN